MDPPLDQRPSSQDDDAQEKNMIDWSEVVAPVVAPAAPGMPAPGDGNRPIESTAGLKRPDDDLERRLRRLSRRGFMFGGVAALAGVGGWRWLVTRSDEGGLPWPLRRVLEFDERLARGL